MKFVTETYGKWILAGEHAVLRGSPALVFPLKSKALRLSVLQNPEALNLATCGTHGKELEPLFAPLLHRACKLAGRSRAELTGDVTLDCEIPLGAGLGASGAFCVAITHWLNNIGWIADEAMYEFARSLENLFHGESSGVDIAVALAGRGLHFERSGVRQNIATKWQPQLYVSYSGQRGITSEAVNAVKKLIAEEPAKGGELDQCMAKAARLCEEALEDAQGFEKLREGIKLARFCFDQWKLAEGAVRAHLDLLEKHGAVAAKPTGSGGGGYVVSLWTQPPPAALRSQLFFCEV